MPRPQHYDGITDLTSDEAEHHIVCLDLPFIIKKPCTACSQRQCQKALDVYCQCEVCLGATVHDTVGKYDIEKKTMAHSAMCQRFSAHLHHTSLPSSSVRASNSRAPHSKLHARSTHSSPSVQGKRPIVDYGADHAVGDYVRALDRLFLP
jgi:hypothetical protein